ncbi:response regulator transcription factor [Lutibacter sp. B2]|nr:response regulator transcription factor [Lutibacter sp. B2]
MNKLKIKVLIADDHALMCQGLKQIIELESDIDVIGSAVDGEDTIRKVEELKPDVVLLDINMPNMNGIQALRRLRDIGSDVKIIMLTFHEEPEYLFQTLNIGANGYVLKDAESDSLIKAIRDVYRGQSYIHPTLSKASIYKDTKEHTVNKKDNLTKREYEVLVLIADGKNNREIADDLFISEKTVKNHVSNIFKKIKVSDRTQAAIYAYKNSLKSI